MLRTISYLFVMLMLLSCGKSGGGSKAVSQNEVKGDSITASDLSEASPVPSAALNFEVNLKLDNLNAQQEDKVLTAADLIKKVVASEEFKNAVIGHTYKGKKTFVDNGGKTNEQIYAAIIEGSENLRPGTDNEMDLDIEVFNRADNTVGYTFPDEDKIWMNSKFLNQNPPTKVTTNMMHEWLHKLGFEHSMDNNPARPYSVPYAVGYLVAQLAVKYI